MNVVAREAWGELVGASLTWGRRNHKEILGEARKIGYSEYVRTWRAKFYKGRKPIYRSAKEGPKDRPVMNSV